LGREDIRAIVEIQLRVLAARLQSKGIELKWTDAVTEHVAAAGFDPQFGARPLKRLIQKDIEDALARALLGGEISAGKPVLLDHDGSKLIVR